MGSTIYSPLRFILLILVLLFVFIGIGSMMLMPAKLQEGRAEPTPTVMYVEEKELTVGEGCKVGGCNAEICQPADEEDAISVCIYRPRFDCYKKARCEKQGDGLCGWIQTETLKACLSKYPETEQ